MYRATVSLKALIASACAASTEVTRYYLCGVCVEISARQAIYVATDGHILFAHREAVEPDNDLVGTWIIPSETIKAAKGRKSPVDFAILEGEPGKLELLLKVPDGPDLEFKAIDGTFPDWRRIIPPETKQGLRFLVPSFNPDHLKRLWKAGAIVGEKCLGIGHNGNSPALLAYATNDTLGVIMPLHNPVASVARPAWASGAVGSESASASASGEAA